MRNPRRLKASSHPLRAILTETIPFELPLSLSSFSIFEFLASIGFDGLDERNRDFSILTTRKELSTGEIEILAELLGTETEELTDESLTCQVGNKWHYRLEDSRHATFYSAPCLLSTKTPKGKRRQLSLLHPSGMIRIANFYRNYEDSILYYCNRSSYSARHPRTVGQRFIFKDKFFETVRGTGDEAIEMEQREYAESRSYFAYSKFPLISRMYESGAYKACERKYATLLRLDISNCFESLYTHSISWVVNGKIASKNFMPALKKVENFGDQADKVFQKINFNETNGIPIGPEASRIFAEIILQEVDVRTERELLNEHGLKYGRDYEIMRYVDDYHVFVNEKSTTNSSRRLYRSI